MWFWAMADGSDPPANVDFPCNGACIVRTQFSTGGIAATLRTVYPGSADGTRAARKWARAGAVRADQHRRQDPAVPGAVCERFVDRAFRPRCVARAHGAARRA